MPFLPSAARKVLSSVQTLFPSGTRHLHGYRGIDKADYDEYAQLVAKQVLNGRVDLAYGVAAGGTVFCIGKQDRGLTDMVFNKNRGEVSRITNLEAHTLS